MPVGVSDGTTYETAYHHAIEEPVEVIQSPNFKVGKAFEELKGSASQGATLSSTMPPGAPQEPAGAFKSSTPILPTLGASGAVDATLGSSGKFEPASLGSVEPTKQQISMNIQSKDALTDPDISKYDWLKDSEKEFQDELEKGNSHPREFYYPNLREKERHFDPSRKSQEVLNDADERPVAGQQYAMMDDDLRSGRPVKPNFGSPGPASSGSSVAERKGGRPPEINWSEQEHAKFMEMKAAGATNTEIANELGKTRNAIIGRTNRLGLSNPNDPRALGRRGIVEETPKGRPSLPRLQFLDRPELPE